MINAQKQTLLTGDTFCVGIGYRILLALRQISHAMDTHSRKLAMDYNITGPQLLCLYIISQNTPTTLSRVSKQLSLSSGTVNGIIDRLEAKSLIQRHRDKQDRRKIWLEPTSKGIDVIQNADKLLDQAFAERLAALPESEQNTIARCLDTIVELMALDTLPDR
jgi:DNA-binding MarR family transcriptional regulator